MLSLAGKLKLDEELALMSHLKVMVSMDSANMHLASLTATPVISIWGATHPLPDLWDGDKPPEMRYKQKTYPAALVPFSATSLASETTMPA